MVLPHQWEYTPNWSALLNEPADNNDKAYTPPSGRGRRMRSRKGRGDLFEFDHHAGYNKDEILAMSSARKAAYEAQRLKCQQQEVPPLAAL
ncbi:hypothetical protein BGX23_003195 [Mortierella sp. AD031]|nr:hypothetical protein BGX23_003195 [Mortierella sp. AD031]